MSKVILEINHVDGRMALNWLVRDIKRIESPLNETDVLVFTNNPYIYNNIVDGTIWRLRRRGWVKKNGDSIRSKGAWKDFTNLFFELKSFRTHLKDFKICKI